MRFAGGTRVVPSTLGPAGSNFPATSPTRGRDADIANGWGESFAAVNVAIHNGPIVLMSAIEKTVPKQLTPWKPGQSGNPAGRPRGSRNKLGEAFIQALYDDFTQHGVEVIEKVREDKPDQYLKVVASILPKEFHVTDATLTDMSDEEVFEIASAIRAARSGAAAAGGAPGGRRGKAPPRTTGTGEPVN